MRLVAGTLEELQARVPARENDRKRPSRHEDLLLPLREADRRDLDPDTVEGREGRRELAPSAVDHEEVGKRLSVAPGAARNAG